MSVIRDRYGRYQYVGVAHIHSLDSDGSRPVPEIVKIGQGLGLDFLLFADHMTLNSLHLGQEGWHGRTFVLVGYEIHDQKNQNHFLAFDVNEVLPGELSAGEYVKEINRVGGLGIIAHPDEVRELPQFPPYPWTAWDAEGFDGIEVWNQMSEWMEGINRFNQLKMFLSPRRILTSPTSKTLKIWDELNKNRKVCGISGVDVHAYPYRFGPLTFVIFPYKVQFQSLRLHLVLKEPLSADDQTAKKQLVRAVRECQIFISNHRRGDATGFLFYARGKSGVAGIGESVSAAEGASFLVQTPRECRIRLLCDGHPVREEEGRVLECAVDEPGNYRVEAYRGRRGWIFSNHIRLVV